MSGTGKSWKIRSAAFEFKSQRGRFYLDVANVMASSKGVAVTKILQTYADRYAKEAAGILARHWLERMQEVGTFSEALRGTIPQEDLAVLAASESSGDLRVGLEKLGTNIIGLDECTKEIRKTMISAVVLILFLHVFLGIEAYMVMPKLEAAMKGSVDISNMGMTADIFFTGARIIRSWWGLWFVFVIASIAAIVWGLKHYVGGARHWLDNHFLPFQIARDFNGASFFVTVGAITGAKGTQVVQLHDALSEVQQNAYPWLKWQVNKIQENLQAQPNSKGEIFNTGIANRRMYHRILDIADYSEMSVMLNKVGDIILKTAPEDIKAKANTTRFLLMLICVALMMGIYGGTYGLIDSFKAAAQLKTMQ